MRKLLLFPFSLLYGLVTIVRNWLYDMGFCKTVSFDFPVISVGNLSVGGTGKSPHIEYLVRLLSEKYSIATLSRGYGRRSRGFVQAGKGSTFLEVGDEPLQFVNKFNHVQVAVDEDRAHGINELIKRFPTLDVILLDDAFQHRAVKPGLSILLTDFFNLYSDDLLLPAGRLREPVSAAKRADIIIVTKTRSVYSPITFKRLVESLKPRDHQKLLLSYIKYGELIPVREHECAIRKAKVANTILLVAGIANPYPLEDHLKSMCSDLITVTFPDHHNYTVDDIAMIKKKFDDIFTKNKIIVTTEKDYMRLKSPDIWDLIVNLPIHYVPIEVELHDEGKKEFDRQILDYVAKNRRNR